MPALAVLRRWPIAMWLFALHAIFVVLIYVLWTTSSSIERGMIWMSVFLIDLPSSYLSFQLDRPGSTGLLALSAILIGGLQWALIGAIFDLIRKAIRRNRK